MARHGMDPAKRTMPLKEIKRTRALRFWGRTDLLRHIMRAGELGAGAGWPAVAALLDLGVEVAILLAEVSAVGGVAEPCDCNGDCDCDCDCDCAPVCASPLPPSFFCFFLFLVITVTGRV